MHRECDVEAFGGRSPGEYPGLWRMGRQTDQLPGVRGNLKTYCRLAGKASAVCSLKLAHRCVPERGGVSSDGTCLFYLPSRLLSYNRVLAVMFSRVQSIIVYSRLYYFSSGYSHLTGARHLEILVSRERNVCCVALNSILPASVQRYSSEILPVPFSHSLPMYPAGSRMDINSKWISMYDLCAWFGHIERCHCPSSRRKSDHLSQPQGSAGGYAGVLPTCFRLR